MFNKIANIIRGVNRIPPSLKKYFKVHSFSTDNSIPSNNENKNKYTNILFCPFNGTELNNTRESILAVACKYRGANPSLLQFDLHDINPDFIRVNPILFNKKAYYKNAREWTKPWGIHLHLFSQFDPNINISQIKNEVALLNAKEILDYTCNEVLIGDLVQASTIRFFLSFGPEWDKARFLKKAREFLVVGIVLTEYYAEILKQLQIDKIVTSHGAYTSWGPLYKLAKKQNIPIDIYNGSYKKDTLRFYHNVPSAPFPKGEWNKFKPIPLTVDENNILDNYIHSRDTQSEDSISLFLEEDTTNNYLTNFIEKAKKEGLSLACLFTNIAWDAFMFKNKDNAFKGMIDWLLKTIEFYNKNKNAYLIIKAHPAEKFLNTPHKYRIKSVIPAKLPNNILFLDEMADIKPFNIYPHLDFGIIHISTVCIEMALQNIPVITSGADGHYSNKGFTIDPSSQQEYFSIINKLINKDINFQPNIEQARRYLYYRFFREAIPFEFLTLEKLKIKKIKIKKIQDLSPNKNYGLDVICEGVLNDESFTYDWTKHS